MASVALLLYTNIDQSKEHVFIVYTCNTHLFCNALVSVIYSVV